MKKYFSKNTVIQIKSYILAHKIFSTILLVVVIFGGYYIHKKISSGTGEIRYVTTNVQKGTLISTVSGSGQVSTTNKVDIKAKVSGDITWVNVKAGQNVTRGQALAGIDSVDAKAAVSDAEISLAQAKLQFQKDQAEAPIDYEKTLDDLATAQNDLSTEYNNIFNTISDTYLDLPNVTTAMQNTLYGFDLSTNHSQWNKDVLVSLFQNDALPKVQDFATKADSDYTIARSKYDASLLIYKQISRSSPPADLEALLTDSINTTTAVAQSLQSELNFLGTVLDVASQYKITIPSQTTVTTLQTNARSYLSTVNSDLGNLLSQKKSLDSIKQTIKTDGQNIELLKVGNDNGDNPISLQIEQTNLAKQERNLEDLKTQLSYYTIVAPFSGTISSVTAKVGDTAGTIATIITNEQIADLSLNEVDAAKIKIGQKATLTFDAIDGLTLTGTIESIDSVGTVSQGVVSYTAEITFDTQDARVKPGMTVNADIQTDVKSDVLYVPSSAVKNSTGGSYVQVFDTPIEDSGTAGTISSILPKQVPVTTGISDDTNVEIVSGLTEGQQVVSRTITGTVKTTTTTTGAKTTTTGARTGGNAGFTTGGVIRL